MSGPRGGLGLELFALSGEAEPEERSDESDEALFSSNCIHYHAKQIEISLEAVYLAFWKPTTGPAACVNLPRPLPRHAGPGMTL